MRSIRLLPALGLALLLPSAGIAAAEPVLERVLLSTGGVGFFGYRAAVGADGLLQLTVPLPQVDDILKSLTVLDGNGAVQAVRLLGPTPLADAFRDAPFDEGALDSLPSLLAALRGAEVEVRGPTVLRGRILALAREEVVQGETTTARHRLSILAPDGGIRSVILEAIDGLQLQDPGLDRQLQRVLERLADRAHEQERTFQIALDGAAGRTVALGHLAEVPLWKASYRLVARERDGLLQGWAILENLSGRDWREVEVTLIAGSPRALRQALFQAYFVPRPEVPVVAEGAEPAPLPAPLAAAAARSKAADGEAAALSAPAALDVGTAEELTAQTLFRLPRRVSLPEGHTAMAPIVDQPVPIERVALYRASDGGPHPRAALGLRNDGDASLPAGLATVYEQLEGGGLSYAGDVVLPQLAPGAELLADYARDANIEVARQEERQGRLDRARIADGILELARVEQQRTRYRVTAHLAGVPRRFVLEQPRPEGWRVAAPADAETRGDRLRVERLLQPGAAIEIAVVLERPVVERFELAELDPERLRLEFQGLAPPPELAEALTQLGTLSGRLAEIDRQIEDAAQEREERIAEQERLRANLVAVPPESDLARRYLDRLAASEDELVELGHRLDGLRGERDRAEAERRAFIRTLRL